jgi:hypothetical protein
VVLRIMSEALYHDKQCLYEAGCPFRVIRDRVERANKRDDVRYAPIAPNLQRKLRWLFSATGSAFEGGRSKKKEGPSLLSAAALQR